MQQNFNPVDKNSRIYQVRAIAAGRYALLIIMGFTVLNMVLMLLNIGQFLMFSASIPYYLTLFARGIDNRFVAGSWPIVGRLTIGALVISLVILTVYMVCWLYAREKKWAQIVGFGMMAVDTLALVAVALLLYGNLFSCVMDLFIHGWALFQLGAGIRAFNKLRELNKEEKSL